MPPLAGCLCDLPSWGIRSPPLRVQFSLRRIFSPLTADTFFFSLFTALLPFNDAFQRVPLFLLILQTRFETIPFAFPTPLSHGLMLTEFSRPSSSSVSSSPGTTKVRRLPGSPGRESAPQAKLFLPPLSFFSLLPRRTLLNAAHNNVFSFPPPFSDFPYFRRNKFLGSSIPLLHPFGFFAPLEFYPSVTSPGKACFAGDVFCFLARHSNLAPPSCHLSRGAPYRSTHLPPPSDLEDSRRLSLHDTDNTKLTHFIAFFLTFRSFPVLF